MPTRVTSPKQTPPTSQHKSSPIAGRISVAHATPRSDTPSRAETLSLDGTITLGPDDKLSLSVLVHAAARSTAQVQLSRSGVELIERMHLGTPKQSTQPSEDLVEDLIEDLVSCDGVQAADEVVRAAMLIQTQSLACGHGNVNPRVPKAFAQMLSRGVTPVVEQVPGTGPHQQLVPMAHCLNVLAGQGFARVGGQVLHTEHALPMAGIEPISLSDGAVNLLVRSGAFTAANAALALARAQRVFGNAGAVLASCDHIKAAPGQDDIDQWLKVGSAQLEFAAKLIESELSKVSTPNTADYALGDSGKIIRCEPMVAAACDSINAACTQLAAHIERMCKDEAIAPSSASVSSFSLASQMRAGCMVNAVTGTASSAAMMAYDQSVCLAKLLARLEAAQQHAHKRVA